MRETIHREATKTQKRALYWLFGNYREKPLNVDIYYGASLRPNVFLGDFVPLW